MSEQPPQPLRGFRVLVVEDSFVLADSLRWALEDQGATVVGPTPTADRALDVLRRETVDVAILDVYLAGASSIPVALALRGDGIPFLFLTGYEDPGNLPEDLQGVPILHKPIDPYDVGAKLREMLQEQSS